MIAQDARWIINSMLSVQSHESGAGVLPFGFLGHAARIVYEGSAALNSPTLGVPALAALLPAKRLDVIARARHALKLLDDTQTSFEEVLASMTRFREIHHAHFTGNAVWFARSLERDLGVFELNGYPLAATMPVQFQVGLEPTISINEFGSELHDVSESLGGALIVLAAATGDPWTPVGSVSYEALGVVAQRDVLAKPYLSERYDDNFAEGLKLLLLLVECQVHTARWVFPLTESAGDDAVFRARFVTLYHSLRTLSDALATLQPTSSRATNSMRDLVSTPGAQLILGSRRVRNRSMHYEIKDPKYEINPFSPMGGIVEREMPGYTFAEVRAQSIQVIGELSECFLSWRS